MYYLGVDLGGTNIKAALVDADGAIIKEASTPTKLPRPAEAVCDDIAALCNQLAQGQQVAGIGVGCPGTVDDAAGIVLGLVARFLAVDFRLTAQVLAVTRRRLLPPRKDR